MSIIGQLLGRTPTPAEIDSKKKKVQALISKNSDIKRAVDELVGRKRAKTEKALETARIRAIQLVMRRNPNFATLIDDAVKGR